MAWLKIIKKYIRMTTDRLRFAIFGNVFQPKKSAAIKRMLACMERYGSEVRMDRALHDFLVRTGDVLPGSVRVFDGGEFDADFAVSMGGDGTFLRAAARVGAKQIPIVGVNMGRLGFLADVSPEEIGECLAALHSGDYSLDSRAVLLADTGEGGGACCSALNDVAILKRDDASMITIHAYIGGQYLTTYQADGLVVSTPTGSTAYSLSNGGPIMVPGSPVLSLTAVAPHSLNIRPIVIPDSSVVSLHVESRSHNFLVAADGNSRKCAEGRAVTIRKAPYEVRVVKRPSASYYDTLREKMMWGADAREG